MVPLPKDRDTDQPGRSFEPLSVAVCDNYEPQHIRAAIERCLEPLGGIAAFVCPGHRGKTRQKVLLKPNLLSGKPPGNAVCTHPAVVEAVAGLALDAGAEVVIGDSPGLESTLGAARRAGLEEVARRLGIRISPFDTCRRPDDSSRLLFKNLELAEEAIDAGAIVNLPKCKTHEQMGMTLAVKNMFGCVVGKQKARWHFQAGRDHLAFARLLLDVYLSLKPTLNLIDAVWSMDGEGPSNGRVRRTGFFAACTDGLHMDFQLCRLLGVDTRRVPILTVAREKNLLPPPETGLNIIGDLPDQEQVKDFSLSPSAVPVPMGPAFLHGILERLLSAKPWIDPGRCTRCGACFDICPADTIELTTEGEYRINLDNCIRCFCCQEICPQAAVAIRRGILSGLMDK
ncbi:MAG: DUF362 domain-containing protein [Gemmatimonadota bacterium]|nr:DUF362 domain-containing protein [Gemmatimonadota bacterium]